MSHNIINYSDTPPPNDSDESSVAIDMDGVAEERTPLVTIGASMAENPTCFLATPKDSDHLSRGLKIAAVTLGTGAMSWAFVFDNYIPMLS